MCGQRLDPVVASLQHELQAHIVRRLRSRHPGWERADGVCPDCVHEAVLQARRERSESSLHADLLLPYPVYSRDEAGVVPTPHRVHASPHYTGRGVTMAFIDSGFCSHPDLVRPRNRILRYVDTSGPEPAEKATFNKPHVTSWHGLMTSCVAAGNGFMSGHLYRGIASRANLVLVKAGSRRTRRIREKDICRSLAWVVANRERFHIRVVNLSVGGDQPSTGALTELDRQVEAAAAEGLVVVAAAGNGNQERVVPPASAPSALTVGGLDDQNTLDPRYRRMYWSNWGRGANGARKPDVIAPALWLAAPMLPKTWVHNEALFLWHLERASDKELRRSLETDYAQARFTKTTLSQPLDEIRRVIRRRMVEQKYIHPHYQHVDGTSMAAPIVSAVAAQMLEAHPGLAPAQIRELITSTADPLPFVPREQQGAGVVNAAQAVAAALRAPGGALAGLPTSPHLTRHAVTFSYHDPAAREVALVGSFNEWQPRGHELSERDRGVWQITIPRPRPDSHRYKFLVDGSRWVSDPGNPAVVEDGCGGFHSVLET